MKRKNNRPTNQEKPKDPVFGNKNLPTGSSIFERGTIILVDATRHTYRVALNSGRTVICNRLKTSPGDNSLLPAQTNVVVSWALGAPYIFGLLPDQTQAPSSQEENPETVTDLIGHGGQDPTLNRNLAMNGRGANEPNDLIPGDEVLSSGDGASVAALRGKFAQLKGSPLAKVQALGQENLVQIIAGIYRVMTWMGESSINNDGGKISYKFRGGFDQLTQSGPDEERYNIKFDLGAIGDILLFELTNYAGQAIFKLHIKQDGTCDLTSTGILNAHFGNDRNLIHQNNKQGSIEENIDGDVTTNLNGKQTTVIEGDKNERIKGSNNLNVQGNSLANYAKNLEMFILENFKKTVTGSITERARQINQFSDDIVLGEGATSHGTKFEELETELNKLDAKLTQLISLYNTHTHPVSGPTAGPTPNLLIGESTINFSLAKSSNVKLK